jgi:electron transfer flavoprotein beta subunit
MNDDTNVPRYVSVRGLRKAMRTKVPVWSAADLGLDPATVGSEAAQIVMQDLFIPEREVRCEIIEGETGQDKARQLALRLQELKLI